MVCDIVLIDYVSVLGGFSVSVSTTGASSTNDLDSLSLAVDSCSVNSCWKSPVIVPDFDANSNVLEFDWTVETAVTKCKLNYIGNMSL